ncbi:hypothetical protein ABZ714_02310 [Streptomyces sp. NPDC006798]|uniref:hypothetical protein n=1 Tax=Streptomyces sp. NPDC006798 TaxID=3155462 RepID=UPI0033CC347C
MPPQAPTDHGPAPAHHHPHHDTTTVERGSFALARCVCGWYGAARRSRDRARTDAAEHLTAPRPAPSHPAAAPETAPLQSRARPRPGAPGRAAGR